MCAKSVTVPLVGRADNATPCVQRRRFRASVTRRGSAEPQRRFSVAKRRIRERSCESMHGLPGRREYGASIHETLRDANGRPWPAGLATALPSTEATTVATTPRADDQMGESVDPKERGRRVGGAGQDSRAGGLDVWTTLTGAQRPPRRRHSSRVEWPAAAPTSMNFARTRYWRGTLSSVLHHEYHLDPLAA